MKENVDQIELKAVPPVRDDEIDLVGLFLILWRSRLTIIAFAIIGALTGMLVVLSTPPIYQANSLLQLEEKSNSFALGSELTDLLADSPLAATEIEILKSRMVVGLAVSRLNLDWSVEPTKAPIFGQLVATRDILPDWPWFSTYVRSGENLLLDFLNVPGDWIGSEITIRAKGDELFEVLFPDGETMNGAVGGILERSDVGFAIQVRELTAGVGREFVVRQLRQTDAVARIRNSLQVTEQGRSTGILRLVFTAETPDKARRILDAIAQSYLAQNANRSAAEAESGLEFLNSQIPSARQAVEEAESALNDFQQSNEAIDLGAEGEALLSQIRSLEADLLDIQFQERELSERFTINHPEYQRLIANRESVQERLTALRDEVSKLPSTQQDFLTLSRDLEEAQETFFQLRNRAQELEVLKASNIGNVRIVDNAIASSVPISPRRNRILALGTALGLIAGAGVVLLRNVLRKRIEGSEELEDLGLPVFASLNRNLVAENVKPGQRRLPLIATETSQDPFVEGLRSLRTSLHFGLIDSETRSVLFTSAAPNAGKSFISANFAAVAAQSGQRVCLVDGDLRRGTLRKYFGVDRSHPGLAQVISGETHLDDALVDLPLENLTVLTSGRFPPNPAELLMREDLGQIINRLDEEFDLIIVDSPPVMAVTDAVIISRAVGATIFIARAGLTHPGEVQATMKILSASGTKISGAILNGFDPKRARGPYGYGYGYAYNYRYTYKTDTQ